MKPLLAHKFHPKRLKNVSEFYIQPKLNGVRALYQNGIFQSREEIPWNAAVLAHLAKPLQEIFPPQVILDGELYLHGWPLQRINAALALTYRAPKPDTLKIEYHVFDVVDFNKSFADRFYDVSLLLVPCGVRYVQTFKCVDATLADQYYKQCVNDGYEGMMYRLGDCPYTWPKQLDKLPQYARPRPLSDQNNRCYHLLKRKDFHDAEFTCVAVVEGKGKREGKVGAFVCDTCAGDRFHVGTGLSEYFATLYFNNPPVGKKIRVKFLTYTNAGIPFNPVFEAVL